MSERLDAITVEVVHQSMAGIVQEMQNALFATGYSSVIRESHDASGAIMTADGRMIAQHTVTPIHLGAFPACAAGVLDAHRPEEMEPGDAFVINHPYIGGSPHASDMAIITPIFVEGQLFGFAGSIAHKSDIGGLAPGSNSGASRELFHDGLMVPPVRLWRKGELVRDVEAIIAANTRTPELVIGDLRGQMGATFLAADRVQRLSARLGRETVLAAAERLIQVTAEQARAVVRTWPEGTYLGEAMLHNDGVEAGRPVHCRVAVTIRDGHVRCDFRETSDQTAGPYNIRPALVRAVCYYVLKCLAGPDLPSNHGLAQVIDAEFREGSVLNPRMPAPVNTYIAMALVTSEALFDAFASAVPEARIAQSSHGGALVTGTLSHAKPGGGTLVQYEILAGAMGARGDSDGVSATTVHVRNGAITPIEILETEFPVQVARFELVPDSGGPGRYRGGLGVAREYRALGSSRRVARGGRELTPPPGRDGGQAGRPSRVILNPGSDRERQVIAADGNVELAAGDVIRYELGGGGGYGDPWTRPPRAVLTDVREGYVTAAGARRDYGVAVLAEGHGWRLDEAATEELRAARPS